MTLSPTSSSSFLSYSAANAKSASSSKLREALALRSSGSGKKGGVSLKNDHKPVQTADEVSIKSDHRPVESSSGETSFKNDHRPVVQPPVGDPVAPGQSEAGSPTGSIVASQAIASVRAVSDPADQESVASFLDAPARTQNGAIASLMLDRDAAL